eukprot:3602013-Rhodomonas_salina.1
MEFWVTTLEGITISFERNDVLMMGMLDQKARLEGTAVMLIEFLQDAGETEIESRGEAKTG